MATLRKRRSPKRDQEVWRGGDFFNPDDSHSVPREMARKGFLVLASELYGVTAALRDSVFLHYPSSKKPTDAEMERFVAASMKWADRYRLRFRWVLDQALETLMFWKLFPSISQLQQPNPLWHPIFHLVKRRKWPERAVPFVFTYKVPAFEIMDDGGERDWLAAGGWDVELERRERFVADARRQFEEALKSYCADQERLATDHGLVKVKRSRASKFSDPVRMKWTVQRYCGSMGFEEIAQAHLNETGENVDVSTIIKAVQEQSELLGLDDEKT